MAETEQGLDAVHRRHLYGLLLGGSILFAATEQRPVLLVVSAACLVMVGYPAALDLPKLPAPQSAVSIERTIEADAVDPGTTTEVTVQVENTGDTWLPAVVVHDEPPGAVDVTGSVCCLTSLRPGETASYAYEITVPRGDHEWTGATVTLRTLSGRSERSGRVAAPLTLRCLPTARSVDLPARVVSSLFAGRLPTKQGGDGLEFHATREYQPGDPLSRVDWNRLARTGELGTVEFRAEHLTSVVLLVDARHAAYLAPDATADHAVERSVRVARWLFEGLLDGGNRVGVAALSTEDVWLPPRAGRDHRAIGLELLGTHDAFSNRPPEADLFESFGAERRAELKSELVERIDRRFDGSGEIVLLSPCCDPYPSRVARRVAALGHAVTIVSPDPTTDGRLGQQVRRLQRGFELRQLRRSGIRVVDWRDEPFEVALRRAEQRWSR